VYCFSVFDTAEDLKHHIIESNNAKTSPITLAYHFIRCPNCLGTFTKADLKIHMAKSHKTCPECFVVPPDKTSLKAHVTDSHPAMCPHCFTSFYDEDEDVFKVHLLKFHDTCPVCLFTARDQTSLNSHIKLGHKNICLSCYSQCNSKVNLKLHIIKVHNRCPECSHCSSAVISHIRVHHPTTCSYCFSTFSTNVDLKVHIMKVHMRCPACFTVTRKKGALETHLSECHPNMCYFCHTRFDSDDDLESHIMKVHKSCSKLLTSTSNQIALKTDHPTTCPKCLASHLSSKKLKLHVKKCRGKRAKISEPKNPIRALKDDEEDDVELEESKLGKFC